MEKDSEEIVRSAGFVMVPVDLIRSGASANAILCFCAMGSFGPESRAKVSSIGKRMRKVRKGSVTSAQKELISLGFLKLEEEATAQSPRSWSLWPYKVRGAQNEGASKQGGLKCTPETYKDQTDNSNKADNTSAPSALPGLELKETPASTKPVKAKAPEPFLALFEAAAAKAGLVVTGFSGWERGQVQLRGSKIGKELFEATLAEYLKAPSPRGHSLPGFLHCMDAIATKVKGRQFAARAEFNREFERRYRGANAH